MAIDVLCYDQGFNQYLTEFQEITGNNSDRRRNVWQLLRLIGGMVDFGFTSCPGATKACDEYFREKGEKMIAFSRGGGFCITGTTTEKKRDFTDILAGSKR